ncbi:MAG: restriction endonuclease subunit S [Candidatus Brocadiaceae bacterium]|nr:restriction endonuclease subunit S [Candidatus Brocadiaceae bacterium]
MKNCEYKKLSELSEKKGAVVSGPFGSNLKVSDYKTEGIPILRLQNIGKGYFIEKGIKYISEEKAEELKYHSFVAGDIALAKLGIPIGKTCIIPNHFQSGIITADIVRIRPDPKKVNYKYLKFFLNTDLPVAQLTRNISGATRPRVNLSNVRDVEIPLPPLPVQKRIVAILDKAFAAIAKAKANAEQNLENAKELFESYLQGMFENKGEGWEEKKIKNLTNLVTKGSSPKWQGISYVETGGIFFLTSKNVGECKLILDNKKFLEERFNEIQKTSILKKGDVLTNIVGASIGRTAVFDLDEITNINQAVCLMRCKKAELYNYYLMYLLNSPFFKSILHDNEVNNARANLSLTFFKNLEIPLPSVSEQIVIVENIETFTAKTKKLEAIYQQKIEDLEDLKKSVLQKAFNGELTEKEIIL